MTGVALKNAVLQANIKVHKALADTYDLEQPHYRPENKVLVSSRLARLANEAGDQTLIDFGCGTGFIIHIAVPYFYTIYGVDITPVMMSKVDLSSKKVMLLEANTESIPICDNVANVITANSFLHHLYDIHPTITEAHRLLKPGGIFYSEEDPNVYFWESLQQLSRSSESSQNYYSDIVQRELSAILETHTRLELMKGIDASLIQLAEYQKMILGGMRANDLESAFYEAGFSQVNIEYYWFLGQSKIMHQSATVSQEIESYLKSVLPLSQHLFKYLRIEARK